MSKWLCDAELLIKLQQEWRGENLVYVQLIVLDLLFFCISSWYRFESSTLLFSYFGWCSCARRCTYKRKDKLLWCCSAIFFTISCKSYKHRLGKQINKQTNVVENNGESLFCFVGVFLAIISLTALSHLNYSLSNSQFQAVLYKGKMENSVLFP